MKRNKFLKIAGVTALSIPTILALNKLENLGDSLKKEF
jgi:hypothetical protein